MMQDIKRLLFFQKGKTLFALIATFLALNCIVMNDLAQSHFSFLGQKHVAKKISHISQMGKDCFVMGRIKSGLQVVGLKDSGVFIDSLLKEIQEYDLIVTGIKNFSGKKRVTIAGKTYEAFFIPKNYSNRAIAFTSFALANDMLKNKEYFVAYEGSQFISLFIKIIAAVIFLALSSYFVYLKTKLFRTLARYGITGIAVSLFYCLTAAVLSVSSSFVLFSCKFCLLCVLFFLWHILFNRVLCSNKV